MPICAYIEHQREWSDQINFIFPDLIAASNPEFVHMGSPRPAFFSTPVRFSLELDPGYLCPVRGTPAGGLMRSDKSLRVTFQEIFRKSAGMGPAKHGDTAGGALVIPL
jgi:hypothetical protein